MAQSGSLQGKLVTLFGGSGFIGIHVAQALLDRGARLRIASRHPEDAHRLKPLANLGQIQFARCDIMREDSVRACLHGSDAAVNLVGAFEGNLRALMGDAAGRIGAIAAENGLAALVQISAIGADEESESGYAAAKARGERLVHQAFPKATIVRPSIVFGEEDGFINMFAGLIRSLPALPVFAPDAPLQPVHVDDLAEAIATAVENPAKHSGKTYELGGPAKVTMMEINRRIAAGQRRERTFIPMSDSASSLFASLPFTPMGRDQWLLLKQGNYPSGDHPGFGAFGIEPKPLDLFLDRWMQRYRKHGRFTGRMPG